MGRAHQLELKKNAGLYLLALVPFVYLALFKYWPMYGVQIAFKDYSVSRSFLESPWVGLKHIQRFIEAPKFWQILKNTLLISLYGVATFPLPILLAVMLNYLPSARYRKTIQRSATRRTHLHCGDGGHHQPIPGQEYRRRQPVD